jgi:hypothetical protein
MEGAGIYFFTKIELRQQYLRWNLPRDAYFVLFMRHLKMKHLLLKDVIPERMFLIPFELVYHTRCIDTISM